tara:strand:+ start:51645 stop:53444 length:1800 start_codon:yes stop_codon:yes gene_type:complete
MKIVCDACGAKYSIADEKVAGKVFKIRCKKCSNIIVVRGNAEEAAAAPPEEQQPNKDTKVFDYQGYDSPQDAMDAEGEWHLVIDQEQVGPMTSAEVRQRFAQGEVDTESYIWKEGFADWERLPDVPEFADLEGGQATVAAPMVAPADDGGMFGGGEPMPEATTESPSALAAAAASSDLFGGDSGGGADLFGGGDAGGASSGADLFGGGAPIGENTGEVVMSKEAEAQLKGQRNENSVLFSLGNLAALASDSPKPIAAAPSSGGAGISNTGGSEGSGLIDIRSMASVYLADKGGAGGGGASTPAGSTDDLPVFSQSAFESASPVLLPTQSSGTDKKVLYALVGVIAALIVAAAVLIVVVLKGDDPENTVAAAPATDTTEVANAGTEGDPSDTKPVEATDPATDPADPETDPEDPETDPVEPETPTEVEPKPKPEPSSEKSMTRAEKRKAARDAKREAAAARAKSNDNDKPESKPKPSSGGCDEVTCLVDPGAACCRKTKPKTTSNTSSSSNSNLPSSPAKSDISKGISKVKGRVMSCGDKHGGKGTVKVKIKIGGNGKVQSATASGGGSSLRSCIASAVKRATFSKSQKGVTVNYPFVFR